MNWKYYNPKFEYEEKLEDSALPWAGHKYFAYDLVSNLKPKVIVELGTHYGTSLWSFSQTVKDQKIDTEINAIDTWEGDKHAGFYGEEVFQTVQEIKNKFYPSLKINLIRKTFDEALSGFEDNSVDILHIDGLHTYEAVKYDFENWLPKVKNDGIVLFHDIKVGENDFGVYKLWEELKTKYITVEFFQSFGLGVLFINKEFGKEIQKKEKEWQMHYSYIHESKKSQVIQLRNREIQKKDSEVYSLNKIIQQKDLEIQSISKEIREKNQEIQSKIQEIQAKDQEIQWMKSSRFWKIKTFYEKFKNPIFHFIGLIKKAILIIKRDGVIVCVGKIYKFIIKNHSNYNINLHVNEKELFQEWKIYRKESREFKYQPLISVIMPVYNVDIKWLKKGIDSVFAQFYENWELCIVDDASTDENIIIFLKKYTQNDKRLKVRFLPKNLHISGASNEAIKMADGEYIALLDNDDEITPNALYEVVKILNENNKIDVIYSDEDKIDTKGIISEITYKPDWSLDRMLHFMYTGHLAIYRKKIIDKINGFRLGYEGAQDYDLMLRFIEQTQNIYHIKKVLYHWRKIPSSVSVNPDSKSYAYKAGKKTLKDYLRRNNIKGEVVMISKGLYEIIKN